MPSKKTAEKNITIEDRINLLNKERPLFEANFVENGGSLRYLEWQSNLDGSGEYKPNWELISKEVDDVPDFNQEVSALAEIVSASLHGWINSAICHKLPSGVYLMPMQPTQAMIDQAKIEYEDEDIDDLDDKVVFAHQAMLKQYQQETNTVKKGG